MTNDTTGAPQPAPGKSAEGRMRGGVKVLFILSLTLNFLVLGVVAGGVIGHFRHPPPPPGMERGSGGPEAFAFGPLAGAFTREDRQAMRRSAEGAGSDLAGMRAQMQSDFAQLDAALRAQPYDEVKLQAVLAEMRARSQARIDLGEQVMLRRIAAMNDAERAAFADRMQKGVERFQHRFDERHGQRPEGGRPGEDRPGDAGPGYGQPGRAGN
ncbi:periplasmic heavy metal sensor [Rhodobacter maris]|uniref:Heavy-metal resistance protein n=1 Tax=Rhodobacter maris TaxID=446682 RepID=A0A285SBD9_9RHOB|nr:periplasmic heavy metal sensor [Rhodobacter maris]SOC02786.1 heavy-metal resistance protein [Rhodobacter maris]